MTNRERASEIVSSVRVGRCAMSMVVLLLVLRRPPYDAVRGWCRRGGHLSARPNVGPPAGGHRRPRPGSHPERARDEEDGVLLRWGQGILLLLGVQLDDQLLLDR